MNEQPTKATNGLLKYTKEILAGVFATIISGSCIYVASELTSLRIEITSVKKELEIVSPKEILQEVKRLGKDIHAHISDPNIHHARLNAYEQRILNLEKQSDELTHRIYELEKKNSK